MKNSNLSTKLMMLALLVTVMVYFGANLLSYFVDPFSTTVAYNHTGENSVTVSGYVVREEEILSGDGDQVYFTRSEGERVSRGGSVALIYDNEQALSDANTLRALEEQLGQLLFARSLAGSVQSTAALDDEINAALVGFHAARASGNISDATDASAAVRAAVLRYSYAYTGTDRLERSIEQVREEIAALKTSVGSATTTVRAPRSGLFSSLTDGYESVLTPGCLDEMTVSDFRAIAPDAQRGLGKLVYGTKWYYVTAVPAKDANNLETGERVTLQFQNGLDRDLSMKIERLSEENGEVLVVLSSDENLSLTTLLRHQKARLIFERYDGIRVPRSAVRIVWEAVTDEEGNPVLNSDGSVRQMQVYGVYCLWGNTARFKRVNILWQEEEYMIVASAEENDSLRRLRAGDQVITAAEDLYDGKVIE